jgi:hypothetical protein
MQGLYHLKWTEGGWCQDVDGVYVPLPFTAKATEYEVVQDLFRRHHDAHAVQVDRGWHKD